MTTSLGEVEERERRHLQEWADATIAENARLRERMEEYAEQFVQNMRRLNWCATNADAALRNVNTLIDADVTFVKAHWARKRTPKYLAKGGVRK